MMRLAAMGSWLPSRRDAALAQCCLACLDQGRNLRVCALSGRCRGVGCGQARAQRVRGLAPLGGAERPGARAGDFMIWVSQPC